MQKRAYLTLVELADDQWSKIDPYFLILINLVKGGQTKAPNRACLEGILWYWALERSRKTFPNIFLPEVLVGAA